MLYVFAARIREWRKRRTKRDKILTANNGPGKKSLKYRIFRLLAGLALGSVYLFIRILPMSFHTPIANMIGRMSFRYIPRSRQLVMKHLEMAYGSTISHHEMRSIALRSNQHMAMNILEFMRFPAMNSEMILSKVNFEGEEYLQKALELNKGVIVLSAHFGNWEMLGAALVARGYPLTVVRRDQEGLLNDVIQKQRDKKGIKTVPRDKPLYKHLVSLLGGNELVALIADQNAGDDGVFVNFFGRPASTFKGPALFALKTGAPIIPIFMVRDGYMKHRIICKPPISMAPCDDPAQDMVNITQSCAGAIEDMIRERPEQWMWQPKRWKSQPPVNE